MNSATGPLAPTTPSASMPSHQGGSSGPAAGGSAVREKVFSPLVKQFLDYLTHEKHFSDYTVKSYGADLIQFGQYLTGDIGQLAGAKDGVALDDKQLKCEPLTIREFLAYLYAQNYTKSTTARKLATLRSFYKFLIRRGMLSVNPLSTIRTPKEEKRLPKRLDLDLQEGVLRVRGKGRKARLTPIGSQAIKALQRYFELRSVDAKSQGMAH